MDTYLDIFIKELRNRNYSRNTIRTYSAYLHKFLEYAENTRFEPEERIRNYLDGISDSPETVRLSYCAISLFYRLVLKKECPYRLEKIKKCKRLPYVLTHDEIHAILNKITNPRHYLLISLLYGSGLRVSEVVNLKVKDLDFKALRLTVRSGKFRKDRITLLSGKLTKLLAKEIEGKTANDYVFRTISGKKYAKRTVQIIFEKALAASGLTKKATCHTLRHSFATELLARGTDIKTIKTFLGHSSVKTTMVYLHLADIRTVKIRSPF